jgi:dTDP-4-amino-4,6-dideoxygalactose transaminase
MREGLLQHIRGNGFDASSWYPPIPTWFQGHTNKKWPNAEKLGATIVNLWVSPDYEGPRQHVLIKTVTEYLERQHDA